MGKYRKRWNEKARAGMVSKQNALKRARQKQFADHSEGQHDDAVQVRDEDVNAEILTPLSIDEKAERKRKMLQELAPAESKVSSSKRKRLEKYAEKQMRREEKDDIMAKLSAEQKIDSSLLSSLKTLGQRGQTKRDKFQEALLLEQKGLGNEHTKAILYEEREVKDWPEEQETSSSFVDNRKFASGFGFENIQKKAKTYRKEKSWREMLNEKKGDISESEDSSGESSDDLLEGEDSNDSNGESSNDSSEFEEWTGFDEEDKKTASKLDEDSLASGSDIDDSGSDSILETDSEDLETGSENSLDESGTGARSQGQLFKEWVRSSKVEEEKTYETPKLDIDYVPVERPEDKEDIEEEIMQDQDDSRKSHVVHVSRTEEIQEARSKLPVVGEEQKIMESIFNNDCIVLCGETGSGKTTQVPQFLYEAGYGDPTSATPGMIGITQPRRVAAMSMAKRVANELGDHGSRVGYQVRFDTVVSPNTAVKFMTDGVLLREMATDFSLSKYSVIIVDEAHERNINTDILIGLLSRLVKLRRSLFEEGKSTVLKLIIMSATLRVSDFTENSTLFSSPPPVLSIQARQFPVSIHFDRRTKADYIEQCFLKASKIHQKLPPGGILIFLTGQNEIEAVCKRLRSKFGAQNAFPGTQKTVVRAPATQVSTELEDIDFDMGELSETNLDDDYVDDEDNNDEEEGFDEATEQDAHPLHVLPLYSLLPTSEQMKVFEEPPAGTRLCVVATNVAETSVTIPGIRYVVDCGRAKERHYEESTGVQSFSVQWISKASADQRAGRAGRTGPGHCYRIYSSALFESDFPQFSIPEILRTPIEGVILQMKAMGIDKVINFPFPTSPGEGKLQRGIKVLKHLGAVDNDGNITKAGESMNLYPLGPRFSKMLILGNQFDCLPYIIAIVAGLTVGNPFISERELGISPEQQVEENDDDVEHEDIQEIEKRKKLRSQYSQVLVKFSSLDPNSDVFRLLSAICAFDYDPTVKFAQSIFVRHKLMDEIYKLRKQLTFLVALNSTNNVEALQQHLSKKLKPPSKQQIQALRQMVSAGFIDQVAIRADLVMDVDSKKQTRAISIPYKTLFPVAEFDDEADDVVFIHPESSLAQMCSQIPPNYIIYASVNLSARDKGKPRLRMKPLTTVTGNQLYNVAKGTSLITYSKPLGPPHGPKMLTPVSRECYVIPRIGASTGTGSMGWDLPVCKVKQVKKGPYWVNE